MLTVGIEEESDPEANELLKCDGALFKEHHLKLRKPTNNPGERDRPPRPGQPVRDMPNLPPHLRNLPPEPAPAAPVDKFAMPPDPTYDQAPPSPSDP